MNRLKLALILLNLRLLKKSAGFFRRVDWIDKSRWWALELKIQEAINETEEVKA